jgi:hypothetical protein
VPGAKRWVTSIYRTELLTIIAFLITIEPACYPAMLEETAGILLQDRIWVNSFDRRYISSLLLAGIEVEPSA